MKKRDLRCCLAWLAVFSFLACSACSPRDPVAGILITNNTKATAKVWMDGQPDSLTVLESGQDVFLTAPPGKSVVMVQREGAAAEKRPVELTLELLGFMITSDKECMALADYTEQYGGSGEVKILAQASPDKPGTIVSLPLHERFYGPNDPLPQEINEGSSVRRFTNVPCESLTPTRTLVWTLYHMN